MLKRYSTHPVLAYTLLAVFLLAILLLPRHVVSAGDVPSGFLFENGSQRADVSVHYPDRSVTVKVIDRKKLDLPNSIQVSFFNKEGKRTDLELSAIQNIPPGDDPKYKRDYRGVLPATQDSFIGAEFKFPLPSLKKSH